MEINRNSWHCKVYLWWYNHKYPNYVDVGPDDEGQVIKELFPATKTNSNLCPYMRAVMFWAPMRALFWGWIEIKNIPLNVFTYVAMLSIYPFLWSHSTRKQILIIYAFVFSVMAGIIGFVWLCYWLTEVKKFKPLHYVARLFEKVEIDTRPVVSFFELFREYLRSTHDRVCPEISWKNKGE